MKIDSRKWQGTLALFAATLSFNAYAGNMDWVAGQFSQFKQSPKKFSEQHEHVSKYDPETLKKVEIQGYFSSETTTPLLENGKPNPKFRDYIFQKDEVQKSAKRSQERREQEGRAAIQANDRPEDLVDELKLTNIADMDGYKTGEVETQPWSDDYWAIYKGVLAARYADRSFPSFAGEKDWAKIASYIEKEPLSSIDDASPAEKYDMIVGDTGGDKTNLDGPGWSLTKAMLREGRQYWSPEKPVETWMGICHGWTPAAIRVPRPVNAIPMLTADGRKMNMYPSDIKALASLLWAKGRFSQKFISGRCDEKTPETDPDNGRIRSQNCFDTNPGTWHQVVVNQIGYSKQSFVLDATWDYEVWNQPAVGYEYVYFNPITGNQADNWKDGLVSVPNVEDQFKKYRSDKTAYVIGVAMKFVYVAETQPSHRLKDNPAYDRKVAVNYLYDLELDKDYNIIGGEWYHHEHPDFIWTATPGSKAVSIGDESLGSTSWDGYNAMSSTWKDAAVYASKKGQPLAGIVNALVGRSIVSQ